MAIWKEINDRERDQLESRYAKAKLATEGFYKQEITGTAYYISAVHGNDSNDGTSPDRPWQHCEMLKNANHMGVSSNIPYMHAYACFIMNL